MWMLSYSAQRPEGMMWTSHTRQQGLSRACVCIVVTGTPVGLPPALRAQLAVQAAEEVLLLRAQEAQCRVLQGGH